MKINIDNTSIRDIEYLVSEFCGEVICEDGHTYLIVKG